MATCDPQELLASAACIDCLSPGLKETLKLQLLCEIANGAGDGGITELTGDVTAGPGTGSVAATIAAGAVTLAKMANLAANSVIGNSTGLSATPQALSAGSVGLAVLATTTQAAARAAIGAGTGSGTVTDVSVTTANGVSGSVATSTTTPAITLTLGAITPTSAAFSGTAGAGFVSLLTQSSDPSAPASGFTQFADSTGRFSWIRQSDGFKRTLDATLTANRVYTLPDATTTIAGLAVAQTFTLANTFQAQTTIPTGSAASPSINFTGTSSGIYNVGSGVFGISINGAAAYSFGSSTLEIASSGGALRFGSDASISRKGTANIQLGLVDAAAPVAQTLSVQSVVAGTTDTAGAAFTIKGSAGTGSGAGGVINLSIAPAGGSGTSQNAFVTPWRISSTGHLISPTDNTYDIGASAATRPRLIYTAGGAVLNNIAIGSGASSSLIRITASSDGVLKITNDATTDVNRIQLGGTTSSFPAIKRSGTSVAIRLADDSADAGITASTAIFSANGALSAPAFSLTGTPITGGTTTTTKPLALIETSGATSTGWDTGGAYLGINQSSGFSGYALDIQKNGSRVFSVFNSGTTAVSGDLRLGSASAVQWNLDTIITRKAAANFQLGAADAAAPVAQTLSVQSVVAGTSNTAGADWTQRGSLGTGTGASGNIVFQLGTPAASGTTQHTASTGLTLSNVGTSGTAAHRATFAGTVATAGYTVATLPAAGTAGRRAYVTDATAPTYLGALVGGGAVVCPVFDNGSAWVSA